jgi:hypothetical protein
MAPGKVIASMVEPRQEVAMGEVWRFDRVLPSVNLVRLMHGVCV